MAGGLRQPGREARNVFGDPDAQGFYWTGHNPTALTGNLSHTRLFVAVGDGVPGPNPAEVSNTSGQVAEIELAQQAKDFVAAAQATGLHPEYRSEQGIHDWPIWRRHLGEAIAWDVFRRVAEAPSIWRYSTVAQTGDMWGLRFRFASPPGTLETFRRRGRTVSAAGAGTVTIRTRDGCRFKAVVPFTRKLPSGCTLHWASSRDARVWAG